MIITIAVILVLFIFCIAFIIFAPREKNYYKDFIEFDVLSEKKELMKTTRELLTHPEVEWKSWPDNDNTIGKIEFLPLFWCSEMAHSERFSKLYEEILKIGGVHSIFFIRIHRGARFKKHTPALNVPGSLRYIYCFDGYCFSESECGIWVNGEIKKLSQELHYVYDASKEHSIYNNTFDSITFLLIDFVPC